MVEEHLRADEGFEVGWAGERVCAAAAVRLGTGGGAVAGKAWSRHGVLLRKREFVCDVCVMERRYGVGFNVIGF